MPGIGELVEHDHVPETARGALRDECAADKAGAAGDKKIVR